MFNLVHCQLFVLISGVTTACFQLLGTKPSAKEQLTNFVMERSKISEHSLTKWVGQGSSLRDFVGEASNTLWSCSCVMGEKHSNLAGEMSVEMG